MDIRKAGLLVFLAILQANIAGVELDYFLAKNGLPTITDYARGETWPGWIIVGLQVVAAIAIGVHFRP